MTCAPVGPPTPTGAPTFCVPNDVGDDNNQFVLAALLGLSAVPLPAESGFARSAGATELALHAAFIAGCTSDAGDGNVHTPSGMPELRAHAPCRIRSPMERPVAEAVPVMPAEPPDAASGLRLTMLTLPAVFWKYASLLRMTMFTA